MDAFTIASWPIGSRATLHRVAWDSNYRDVVRFEDEAEREAYFNSLDGDSIEIDKMTYLRPNEPIRINIPYSACYNYNYIVVENPELPVPGEITPPKLFYFISGVAFDAPNTSIISVQLDVFQTYLFDFELGYSFLDRGHWAMSEFNKLVHFNEGKPRFSWNDARKYLTTPEGLDIGNEYVISWADHVDLSRGYKDKNGDYLPDSEGYAILVMSTTDLRGSWGTADSPTLNTASGVSVDGLASGCDILLFWTYSAFLMFKGEVSQCPWISSGIICITAVPKVILYEAYMNGDLPESQYNGTPRGNVFTPPETNDNNYEQYSLFYNFIDAIWANMPEKCKHFYKLYTFPYCVIEISAKNGCSLLLKPELLNTETIELHGVSCITPGNIRLALYPGKYGTTEDFDETEYEWFNMFDVRTNKYDHGYNIDCAIWFDNFPQFSICNDNYLMYLAGTVHTREYQYQAAGWGQSRSQMQADQNWWNQNERLEQQRTNWGRTLQAQTYAGYVGGLTGIAGAALNLNPMGVASAIGGGATNYFNAYNQNLNMLGTLENESIINDQNNFLSQQIIQGDYQNAIAAIDATVQDAALTLPSQSGANGGNGFNVANGYFGYDIRFKTPNTRFINIICNFWGRYGYSYHQTIKPPKNLKCMKHFTYWKMKDTYITSSKADETSKNVIRAMFERGVTVWNKAEEIGKVDPLDNWEV